MTPQTAAAVTPTTRPALDESVSVVSEQRRAFARMSPADKAKLLRSTLPLLDGVAREWAEAIRIPERDRGSTRFPG